MRDIQQPGILQLADLFWAPILGLKHYERRPYWGEDGTVCALLSWVHASRGEGHVKKNRYSSRKALGARKSEEKVSGKGVDHRGT